MRRYVKTTALEEWSGVSLDSYQGYPEYDFCVFRLCFGVHQQCDVVVRNDKEGRWSVMVINQWREKKRAGMIEDDTEKPAS